jgi:hypothetical protein
MAGSTVTPDVRHNTAYSFLSAQHYGLKVQTGVYTPSTGTTQYTTAGDSITFPGVGTPIVVLFGAPKVGSLTAPSTEVLFYLYDNVNKSVRWYGSSTGGSLERTTAQSAEGYTAPYVCFGFV